LAVVTGSISICGSRSIDSVLRVLLISVGK